MASNSKEGKGLDPPRVVFPASRAKYTKKADRGRKPAEGERPSTPVIPASRQAYAEAKKVEKSSALSPIERSRQRSARKKERLHTVGAVSGDAAVSEPTAAVAEDHPSATQQTRGEATGGDPYSVPLEDLESATASAANDVSLVPEPPLLEARIVSEREIVQAVPAPDLDANNQETEDRKGKILISRRWLYILGFILLVGATMAILFIAGALPSGQSNDDSGTPAPAAASSGESTDNNALSTAVDPTEVLTTVPPKEPTEGPARASSREPTNIPTEAPLENSVTELPTLEFLPDPQIGSSATMYDVRYAGRFQMVQEPGFAADGSSQVVCNNTCAGDACEKLFIGNAVEGDFGDLALFGEIYFLCTGPRVVDATGWMSMKPTGQGSCNTSATNDSIGAAFVTTQLGAYGVVVDNYVFDDLYFECNTDSISVSIGGVYSCTVGITCIDDACSFTIKPLNISADIHHFASQLIHSNDGSRIPSVPNPINGVSVLGSRTALFQVSSGFYYNETACSGRVTGLQMTCLNGTISLVQNQSTMVCSVQRNNMIQCNETRTAINPRNEYFPILRYECTAIDQVPQTTVENTDSSVECSFSEEQEVSLELQLGIICSDGSIMYDDYFYECAGEQSTLVSREGNFTCGIVGVVPVAAGQVGFAVASIETDFRWGNMAGVRNVFEPSM
ncbi:expressed unknown protein [Seminavis robusta]|uniref:Uncharacterized protein n=1 Tax=Seminavis robusta TaxID=568900 RepID=A0A9N8HN88_9STRA|nr:expressed unknown protein [Seminavis robusta]|eukprot:Sro802_g204610.1 n/a (678) ;mRNA; r:13997-16289